MVPRDAAARARPRDPCTGVGNAVGVRLPRGFCLQEIARGLLRPRQLTFAPTGQLLVAESGRGWARQRGRVGVLTRQPDGRWSADSFLLGLDRPHGIAWRDGHLWVAAADRIVKAPLDLGLARAEQATTVLGPLPATGRHVHKTLGFGPDGALYFSIGSGTDNGAPNGSRDGPDPCPEAEALEPLAARGVVNRWDPSTGRLTVFARGLRNNLGLAWHPTSGSLWGVENARDYIDRQDPTLSDALLPHEELNHLVEGGRYGWPYCYDDNLVSPEYARSTRQACAREAPPAQLLPAHAAPISVLFYTGAMFPGPWRGRAFVTYHGYRATGHRVVTVPFGADGRPSGPAEDFINGWEERPGRPHGHLLGLAQGPDGALYLSDDVGGFVYRVAYGESALEAPAPPPPPEPEAQAVVDARCAELSRRRDALSVLQRTVLDGKCVPCHAASAGGLTLRRCDWRATYEALAHGRSALADAPYIAPGGAVTGVLAARLHGEAQGPRMPPPPASLTAEELARFDAWLAAGAPPP